MTLEGGEVVSTQPNAASDAATTSATPVLQLTLGCGSVEPEPGSGAADKLVETSSEGIGTDGGY